MTEKIGLIKNPLTIIAIFAGIAEVSGTIVLPFIATSNQVLFIYFLILFPSILVILFFITLNFNNRVLYAPSDYKDEQNYIKINRYDLSSQRNVEVKVLKNDAIDPQYIKISEKLELLNNQIIKLEAVKTKTGEEEIIKKISKGEFLVSNFSNAHDFLRMMASKGYDFEIYHSPIRKSLNNDTNEYHDFDRFKAIWLGTLVPLSIAKEAIALAKEFYPHLEYIHLAGDHKSGGQRANIYIGGATETAEKRYKLRKLNDADFKKIDTFNTEEELHSFIRSFY